MAALADGLKELSFPPCLSWGPVRTSYLMFLNLPRLTLGLNGVPEQDRVKFFNPNRMHLARKRKGLSKTEFAHRIGVDLRAISAYGAAQYSPAEDTLRKIEDVTKFPRDFFYGDELE